MDSDKVMRDVLCRSLQASTAANLLIALAMRNFTTEWTVHFIGKIIKVINRWNWSMEGSADLYLDDEHLDQNTDMLINPKKALLSKYEVSDDIKSIDSFCSRFF